MRSRPLYINCKHINEDIRSCFVTDALTPFMPFEWNAYEYVHSWLSRDRQGKGQGQGPG